MLLVQFIYHITGNGKTKRISLKTEEGSEYHWKRRNKANTENGGGKQISLETEKQSEYH